MLTSALELFCTMGGCQIDRIYHRSSTSAIQVQQVKSEPSLTSARSRAGQEVRLPTRKLALTLEPERYSHTYQFQFITTVCLKAVILLNECSFTLAIQQLDLHVW